MTTVYERTRSVVQTREFLQVLSKDKSLPESIRRQAETLLRHYPTAESIWLAGRVEERSKEELSLLADKHGPMHPVLVSWLLSDPIFCGREVDPSSMNRPWFRRHLQAS
ncbi:BPSL0761 family protein [Pseudomonas aeruginosa]|uniref:BPSL0761 family protein n=1 Tax=Pseudomonas aeruginosa TaxID=287 RepID=UPI002795B346|nr:BPSL0761 family protein [Pseudomonas aeruginosa]